MYSIDKTVRLRPNIIAVSRVTKQADWLRHGANLRTSSCHWSATSGSKDNTMGSLRAQTEMICSTLNKSVSLRMRATLRLFSRFVQVAYRLWTCEPPAWELHQWVSLGRTVSTQQPILQRSMAWSGTPPEINRSTLKWLSSNYAICL